VEIRREQPSDEAGIRAVNDLAFGRPNEGAVIDALRRSHDDLLSLVAVEDGRVVGHILFSPVQLEALDGRLIRGMGLAPLAVLPECQRRGIGGMLTSAGLDFLRKTPCPFVVVLGHAGYYPRFGFERASIHGLRCQWEVPDEAFMVIILDEGAMRGAAGIARYLSEFDAAT
jgi:putative acetyltransferase